MYDGKGKKRYHRKIKKKNQKSKRPTKSERKKKNQLKQYKHNL